MLSSKILEELEKRAFWIDATSTGGKLPENAKKVILWDDMITAIMSEWD